MNNESNLIYRFHFSDEEQQVRLKVSRYVNDDNLYVGLNAVDPEDGSTYHFTDLTVNVSELPYLHSAVDTNNNLELDVMNFLTENGIAQHTGKFQASGYCMYPVYEFDPGILEKTDPEQFREYQVAKGAAPKHPKAEKTAEDSPGSSEKQTARERAAEKNAGRPEATESRMPPERGR